MRSPVSVPLLRYMLKDIQLQIAFYLFLAIQSFITIALFMGYAESVASVGLDFQRSVLYRIVIDGMSGIYGQAIVDLVFAYGPIRFAFYVGGAFPILFIVVNGIVSLGSEIRSGFLRLVLYAPITETEYVRTVLLRDVFCILIVAAWGGVLSIFGSLAYNFSLGPWLITDLIVFIFFSIVLVLVGTSASRIADHVVVALGIYTILFGAFLVTHLMRMTVGSIARTGIHEIIGVVTGIISPFFFAEIMMTAHRIHDSIRFTLGIAGFGMLIAGFVYLQTVISRLQRRKM